jgi:hypothetical protein
MFPSDHTEGLHCHSEDKIYSNGLGDAEMKKSLIFALSAIFLVMTAGCAPGTSVQVNTPSTSMQLTAPGQNPMINQPDVNGRIARAGAGLWHGLIAPATLIISFFSPDIRMYEVHNTGSEYDLGFLLGLALVLAIIGLLFRMRR